MYSFGVIDGIPEGISVGNSVFVGGADGLIDEDGAQDGWFDGAAVGNIVGNEDEDGEYDGWFDVGNADGNTDGY